MTRDRQPARALALLLPLVLGGCPFDNGGLPDQELRCEDGAPPQGGEVIQLGREQDGSFVPLTDGQALPIYTGPQGGQHVYTSVRLFTTTRDRWGYQLRLVDGTMAERGGSYESVDACAGRWVVAHYLRVILRDGSPISGATLSVEAKPVSSASTSPLRALARVQVVAR